MKIKLKHIAIVVFLLFSAHSCTKTPVNPEPIDNVPVNQTINLALPIYEYMNNMGSHLFLDGGVKGIVLVHGFDDAYYAFDRTCSYQPKSSCARLELDSTAFQFRCGSSTDTGFVKCCDSRFSFEGDLMQGPASFGLRHYQVFKQGNLLNIQN